MKCLTCKEGCQLRWCLCKSVSCKQRCCYAGRSTQSSGIQRLNFLEGVTRPFCSYMQCLKSPDSNQKVVVLLVLQGYLPAFWKLETAVWNWVNSVPLLCSSKLSVVRPVFANRMISFVLAAVVLTQWCWWTTRNLAVSCPAFFAMQKTELSYRNLVKCLLPLQGVVTAR